MTQKIKPVFQKCKAFLGDKASHATADACWYLGKVIGQQRGLYLACHIGAFTGHLQRGEYFEALTVWLPQKYSKPLRRWYGIKRGWITVMPWDKEYKGKDKVFRSELGISRWEGKKESKGDK